MGKRTALLIGATGLVGEQCLKALVAHEAYDKVVVLARRDLGWTHPKIELIQTDFDKLEAVSDRLLCDEVYCALGTTIAKAGSQEAFHHIDFDYPLKVAEMALWKGAKRFILVSALGADAHATVFYNRVKGELEEALMQLGFEALIIFRPSILLGHRHEKRRAEAIGQFVAEKFSFLFAGPLKKYRGTPADLLANAMVRTGTSNVQGIRIIENNEIFTLGSSTNE